MMKPFHMVLIVYLIVSFLSFVLYGIDKRRARKKRWRIREGVLLGCSFFGGAIGALLGMNLFRHKTKHWYFWAVSVLGLIWQTALAVWMWYR